MKFTQDASPARHPSPPLGILAIAFAALFIAGLIPVTSFSGLHFPGPWQPAATIVHYFQARPGEVLICALLQFGSAIPLGILTASAASRFQFLGVRAAGPWIALFGGLMTAFNIVFSASILWVMAYPGIAQDPAVLRALYYVSFILGGPGFSVPFGLLIAGICVPAAFTRLLPRWLLVAGFAIAVAGELSWLYMLLPGLLFLIPLTRFPGFLWLIAAGFLLPTSARKATTFTAARS